MNWQRLVRSRQPEYDRRSHGLKIAYGVALPVLGLLVCEWLRPLLAPLYEAPFVFAVALVAWLSGPLYGIGALAFSAVLLAFFFLEPSGSRHLLDAGSIVRMAVFVLSNAAVIALVAFLHRAGTELAFSEQAYRRVSELLPFGTWSASPSGAMLRVSESFLRTFGTTLDECRGDGWLRFIEASQREQVKADWFECMRSSYFWDYEYRMESKSGQQFVVLSRGVPVRSPSGRVTSWVGIHLDITAMHGALEERITQARDLARFNAELEQFAYISAHDLQEPLRMIASYLQLLERRYKDKLDEDANAYIGYAVEGANRLRALLQDLLILQQIGKGNRPKVALKLENTVKEAIAAAGIAETEATIICGPLPEIIGDAYEFRLLFSNLLDNAIQYGREGVKPEIRIAASQTADGWAVSVCDNGIGIAPEYHFRIFEVFQRLHSRARYQGTGIGLAIVKKVVEVHGGRIWVESSPGAGTTFHFTVPA